jgi:magnesium transporter
MIRAFYRSSAGQVTLDLPATDWHAALREPHGVLWVDFDAALPSEVEPLLRDPFGFHVLAIDDALRQTHVPKIDDWGDYIYASLYENKNNTIEEICKTLNVSRATLYRYINTGKKTG